MGNTPTLTKDNAITFLNDRGFVVLGKGEFKKLNREVNNIATQNTLNRHFVDQLEPTVDSTGQKFIGKLNTAFDRITTICASWAVWFEENGGEGFDEADVQLPSTTHSSASRRSVGSI